MNLGNNAEGHHADDPRRNVRDMPDVPTYRGEDPDDAVGYTPADDPVPGLDPHWDPDPDEPSISQAELDAIAGDHEPRREDILPYLLIRGTASGDRGQRPLWPDAPSWESPDILLVEDNDDRQPFSRADLIETPRPGKTYRVFVHVWNLGLFPALAVRVQAWHTGPGHYNPGDAAQPPTFIGGAMVELDERTRAGCHRVVEINHTWAVPSDATGHDTVLASLSCPADTWSGTLDPSADRHVGQRGIAVLSGDDDALELLRALGRGVPDHATVRVTHAGVAGQGSLQAITNGRLSLQRPGGRTDVGVDAAPGEVLRTGVAAAPGQPLLTMRRDWGAWGFAPFRVVYTTVLHEVPGQIIVSPPRPGPIPGPVVLGSDVGDIRLDITPPPRPGSILPEDLSLPLAFAKKLGILSLRAGAIAAALGGSPGQQHVLRFSVTDAQDHLIGGYTIVFATEPTAPAGNCTATYRVVSQWPGGFHGEVTVANGSASTSAGWTASFAFADGQTVTHAWNATVTQSGATVTARSMGWNGRLAPGGTATFGFLASSGTTNTAPAVTCALT